MRSFAALIIQKAARRMRGQRMAMKRHHSILAMQSRTDGCCPSYGGLNDASVSSHWYSRRIAALWRACIRIVLVTR